MHPIKTYTVTVTSRCVVCVNTSKIYCLKPVVYVYVIGLLNQVLWKEQLVLASYIRILHVKIFLNSDIRKTVFLINWLYCHFVFINKKLWQEVQLFNKYLGYCIDEPFASLGRNSILQGGLMWAAASFATAVAGISFDWKSKCSRCFCLNLSRCSTLC